MKIFFAILLAGISLAFVSCKCNRGAASYDVEGADSLPYSMYTLDTVDAGCSNTAHCPKALIRYPLFKTPDNSLNAFLAGEINHMLLYESETTNFPDLNTYLKKYFSVSEVMKQNDDEDWEMEKTALVIYKKRKYLTLEFSNYLFEGGAHPNSATEYKTYDLILLKEVKAADLFINLEDEGFLRLGEKYFRKDNKLDENASFADAGYFTMGEEENFDTSPRYGKFRFNDNYALTKDGIQFMYNPYEIGPYALGPSKFIIPYSELKPYLKLTLW
jgi:hypothetical protein